jgi:hypothetical protein
MWYSASGDVESYRYEEEYSEDSLDAEGVSISSIMRIKCIETLAENSNKCKEYEVYKYTIPYDSEC